VCVCSVRVAHVVYGWVFIVYSGWVCIAAICVGLYS
jgi:hypothetical protein